MKRQKTILSLTFVLVLLLQACNLPSNAPDQTPTPDALLAAQMTITALAGQATPTQALPTFPAPPTLTATPAFTPTTAFTSTPSFAYVTLSEGTNCRTGPSDDYPIVGALIVGQVAEIVGRQRSGTSWYVVRLPGTTSTCWLWTNWATVTGVTSGLPIIDPPPIPATKTSTRSPYINITVQNNSGSISIWRL